MTSYGRDVQLTGNSIQRSVSRYSMGLLLSGTFISCGGAKPSQEIQSSARAAQVQENKSVTVEPQSSNLPSAPDSALSLVEQRLIDEGPEDTPAERATRAFVMGQEYESGGEETNHVLAYESFHISAKLRHPTSANEMRTDAKQGKGNTEG